MPLATTIVSGITLQWSTPNQRPVYQTGLRPNMEIIAINGMDKALPTRELIAWFRLNHQPGDEIVYTVSGGKQYRFTLPED